VLYVDSSALAKRCVHELGSAQLNAKIDKAASTNQPVLTSVLSFAEIHAAFARLLKAGAGMSVAAHHLSVIRFNADWRTYLTPVDLSAEVLRFIPNLVMKYSLRGSDGVHLASANWMREQFGAAKSYGKVRVSSVFATADKQLARAAESEQFQVFDPESGL
jgi:predicted nucleic acid-binding protein